MTITHNPPYAGPTNLWQHPVVSSDSLPIKKLVPVVDHIGLVIRTALEQKADGVGPLQRSAIECALLL